MRIWISGSRGRLTVAGQGVGGIIVLAGLVTGLVGLPYLWGGRLEPAEAEKLIRQHLMWRVSNRLQAELEGSGRDTPDQEMAKRWERQMEWVKDLEFELVEVKQAWIGLPMRKRTNFIVKVVLRYPGQDSQTRYFWFNGVGNPLRVRESSIWAWRLPI